MRRTFLTLSVGCLALVAWACGGGNPISPSIPLPTASTTAPSAPFAFAASYTPIVVGEMVHRRVADDNNPDCVLLPGWHCHYFRITAPSDGELEVVLTWLLESQPSQPLDLSLEDSHGVDTWSDYGPGPRGKLLVNVKAGTTYQLTVWYTFTGVEFELRSSFESN